MVTVQMVGHLACAVCALSTFITLSILITQGTRECEQLLIAAFLIGFVIAFFLRYNMGLGKLNKWS